MADEKKHEKKLRLGVEALGGLCLKFPATYYTGIPDRLCICPGGLVFFVEAKSTGKQLRPRQLYVAKKLEALGVKVYVANSDDMVSALLKSLNELYTPKPNK